MIRKSLVPLAALAVVALTGTNARAHCQVPCGIYDDPMRFAMLEEEVTTIEKSMKQIEELSKAEHPNYNQIVRWVMNKDNHADAFSEIVTYYFMAQRIKPVEPTDRAAHGKYLRELTMLHHMVVYAMKCKQTTDLENCAKLRELIAQFKASYLGEAKTAEAHTAGTETHTHSTGSETHTHN